MATPSADHVLKQLGPQDTGQDIIETIDHILAALSNLPRWARVAFAARAARRAQKVVGPTSGDAKQVIDDAITLVETAASNGDVDAGVRAPGAGDDVRSVLARRDGSVRGFMALAAICATDVLAAYFMIKALPEKQKDMDTDVLYAAAGVAAAVVASGGNRRGLATDLDTLSKKTITEGYNDNTCVPPEVFGPL